VSEEVKRYAKNIIKEHSGGGELSDSLDLRVPGDGSGQVKVFGGLFRVGYRDDRWPEVLRKSIGSGVVVRVLWIRGLVGVDGDASWSYSMCNIPGDERYGETEMCCAIGAEGRSTDRCGETECSHVWRLLLCFRPLTEGEAAGGGRDLGRGVRGLGAGSIS
jgi:hypothetical protein